MTPTPRSPSAPPPGRWRRLIQRLDPLPPWAGVLLAVLVYLTGYSVMTTG